MYGTVLGGLAAVYGPARSPASVALDSLSANLIVQRGVSGAGLGGYPQEPEKLRLAGRMLQREPRLLGVALERAAALERVAYPAWPGR